MSIELGMGLIGIGREWGQVQVGIPEEKAVLKLLEHAIELGITFFDTAPAYGLSEQRLGDFLNTLSPEKRKNIFIATKFGEHWDKQSQSTYVDHSYKALKESLDSSLIKLGKIDLLQFHKTTPAVLESNDVRLAINYAKSKGIKKIGASISDEISGQMAIDDDNIDFLQLPFNENNPKMHPIIQNATRKGKKIIINRPFDTGKLVVNSEAQQSRFQVMIGCFEFILKENFEGYILTGTKSIDHLEENVAAFIEAQRGVKS